MFPWTPLACAWASSSEGARLGACPVTWPSSGLESGLTADRPPPGLRLATLTAACAEPRWVTRLKALGGQRDLGRCGKVGDGHIEVARRDLSVLLRRGVALLVAREQRVGLAGGPSLRYASTTAERRWNLVDGDGVLVR